MRNLRLLDTGRWEVRLGVPADVRNALGRREFKKSLGHISKQEAEILAGSILSEWKGLILKERQRSNGLERIFNSDLAEFSQDKEKYRQFAVKSLNEQAGIFDPSEEQILAYLNDQLEDNKDIHAPMDQVKATFSEYCYPASFLNQYVKEKLKHHEGRSQSEHIGVINNQFIASFPVIDNSFSLSKVQQWWDKLNSPSSGKAPSTLRKYRSHCRSYMDWLIRKGYTNRPNYFDQLEHINKKQIAKEQRKRGTNRKPFTDDELLTLWTALVSKRKPDKGLNDLFLLGLFTGCRIEELCNLTDQDVKQTSDGRFYLEIPISKTEKGIGRKVPLHKTIEPIILGKSGYIIDAGKVNNKYGERSSSIGKKFGRLKDSLGFERGKVFHSLRMTFINKLKNAETPEIAAADIVGHEVNTMTYGVYATETPVELLFKYVDLVSYSELEELL
jgi:integrase